MFESQFCFFNIDLCCFRFSKDDGSNEYAKSLIKNKAYANLHDFDEHLEDIELHWIGTPLASALLGSGTQRSR